MSRVTRISALLMSASTFGCLGGSVPAPELYRLAPAPARTDSAPSRGHLPGSLAVERYVTPGIYGERGIVYRIDETRYGVYPYREWALPLGEMLGLETEDVLAAAPLTSERAVFEPATRRGVTYIWRGSVRQFEEADRGKQVFAVVAIEAKLVRASDDSVMWRGMKRLEREVPEGAMPAIVTALSELSRQALTDLVTDARGTVETIPATVRQTKPSR
ncbi:MAG: ABC-type transport auxiliary lipoprotein family protein [Gemmatimonadota bacterium]|nr:ABC-type transport auxiliary lipoprotein family protein [Gemmatimonadota bacterium]